MVYSEHDLAYNITNALAVNDSQAGYEILMSEISNLLYKNKPALIRILQSAGGKLPDDASDKKVADAVAEVMVKGKKDILFKIWEAVIKEKSKYSNANDIVTGALELGTGIVKMAGEVTVAKLQADTAKRTGKDALAVARINISNTLLAGKGATDQARIQAQIEREKGAASGANVGTIVGGVIAVVVVGAIGFILYKKTASGGAASAATA